MSCVDTTISVFVGGREVVLFVRTCRELFALEAEDLHAIFCGQSVDAACDSCAIRVRPL